METLLISYLFHLNLNHYFWKHSSLRTQLSFFVTKAILISYILKRSSKLTSQIFLDALALTHFVTKLPILTPWAVTSRHSCRPCIVCFIIAMFASKPFFCKISCNTHPLFSIQLSICFMFHALIQISRKNNKVQMLLCNYLFKIIHSFSRGISFQVGSLLFIYRESTNRVSLTLYLKP